MSLFDYATGEPDVEFDGERACIICGCSDNRACEGGCSWKSVDPPVCSNCCGVAAAECFPTVTASWNPCPLESDHDGNHVFWQQTVRDGNDLPALLGNGAVVTLLPGESIRFDFVKEFEKLPFQTGRYLLRVTYHPPDNNSWAERISSELGVWAEAIYSNTVAVNAVRE